MGSRALHLRGAHAARASGAHRRGHRPAPSPLAYIHQAAAIAAHDTYERLNQVSAPTLVVHGEQDIFIPPANAVVLAERIPGAQLRLWPDAAHMYMIDQPRADEEIADFLARQGAAAARSA